MYGFGVQRDPLLSAARRIACTHLFRTSTSTGNWWPPRWEQWDTAHLVGIVKQTQFYSCATKRIIARAFTQPCLVFAWDSSAGTVVTPSGGRRGCSLAHSNFGLLISKLCHSILKTPNTFIHPTSPAANLNEYWILELVFPWIALTTIGHHAGAIQAPEIWGWVGLKLHPVIKLSPAHVLPCMFQPCAMGTWEFV